MGANSKIQWTDHTFNPWIGCVKVSEGCKYCYAETLDKRWGNDRWGPGSKRQRTGNANWQKPMKWNEKAAQEGKRYKVFCASLADVFEDNDQVIDWRLDLFDLIKQTPMLDWLILTKRPEIARHFFRLRSDLVLNNVWLGTSIENQATANERIRALCTTPAEVHFISYEPAIGWLDFELTVYNPLCRVSIFAPHVDWVIVGGESGPSARPFYLEWAELVIEQCQKYHKAAFVKQLGSNAWYQGQPYKTQDFKGGNWDEWPEHLRIRDFPR